MSARLVASGLRVAGARVAAFDAARAVRALTARTLADQAAMGPGRVYRLDGRWRIRPMLPAFPSPAFERWLGGELGWMAGGPRPLVHALLAVTTRCPLTCTHCSAADELGPEEALEVDVLAALVDRLVDDGGVTMLHLTGGEPMARFDAVEALAAHARGRAEVWVNTAGVGLTPARAGRLAAVGVSGIWLSVDHPDPARHDVFRGRTGTFGQARDAAAAARRAGLAVGLSMCATRASIPALPAMAALATAWGAYALRVIEPHAVGRWAGAPVTFDAADRAAVADFADATNALADPRAPFVLAEGVVGERLGCRMGGDRALYVDARGGVRSCPFATRAVGDLRHEPMSALIERLRARGCGHFPSVAADPERGRAGVPG